MNRTLIESDDEAKRIADMYGVAESMLAESARKLPDSIAAGTGFVIAAKRAAAVKDIHFEGPFEFVFITFMAGFIGGENGWSVFRWSDVSWDDLPEVMHQIDLVEKQLLPQAVGADTATPKFEAWKKAKDNLAGQG